MRDTRCAGTARVSTCSLPDAAIDAFLAWSGDPFRPGARMTLNGGAISDVPDEASAFSHRDALIEFTTSAGWSDPDEDGARIASARTYAAGLEPFASGVYVNTVSDPGDGVLKSVYSPAKLARLQAVKRTYDPANTFHLTQNIRP